MWYFQALRETISEMESWDTLSQVNPKLLWIGSEWLVYSLHSNIALKVGRTIDSHNRILATWLPWSLAFMDWFHENIPDMRSYLPVFYGILKNSEWQKLWLLMESFWEENTQSLNSEDPRVVRLRQKIESKWKDIGPWLLERSCFLLKNWNIKFGDMDTSGYAMMGGKNWIEWTDQDYIELTWSPNKIPTMRVSDTVATEIRKILPYYDQLSISR
jgi:hypothetical protein